MFVNSAWKPNTKLNLVAQKNTGDIITFQVNMGPITNTTFLSEVDFQEFYDLYQIILETPNARDVAVFDDMHDGDKKVVIVSKDGSEMIIKPIHNNQTWIVKTKFDQKTCSAVIDFNVPGKPGPPPVNLTATFLEGQRAGFVWEAKTTEYEFTDPSGTLAAADFPLNHWVQDPDVEAVGSMFQI